jgi:protein involved in polysaccharide export with SLBB domain
MVCRRLPLLIFALMVACSGAPPAPRNFPAPEQSTVVGAEDLFEITVVGEKDLPHEFQVQPDGSIDFPYLGRVQVAGLEPQEIVDVLRKKLAEEKILQDPQITMVVKQYNSKKVNVIGQVQKPDSVAWAPGMTLVVAITRCGGFTPMADSNHVILIRRVAKERTVKAVVSVDAITNNSQQDIALQPGDTINVEQRVF